MSELSPKQTVILLLEAIDLPEKFSGVIQVIHGQNHGVRHVVAEGKTHFIERKYKTNLIPALKSIASPLLRESGGSITYRLHDGISVDIKFEDLALQNEIKAEQLQNKGKFYLSKTIFMHTLTRITLDNWIKLIERGESSTPLIQLKTQYAKLA